jgi:hypothetical protein
MIATFIEQRFPHPISTYSRLGLDYDPHVLGQEYAAPLSESLAKLAPKA